MEKREDGVRGRDQDPACERRSYLGLNSQQRGHRQTRRSRGFVAPNAGASGPGRGSGNIETTSNLLLIFVYSM